MLAAVLHGAKDLRLEPRPVPELQPGMVRLRVRRVGICGSDMHYFADGYIGVFVPSQPFVMGHELTADVAAVGAGVTAPAVGARVTVNPARACGFCAYCKGGRGNLCRRTIMLGSASTKPPTDGAMAEYVAVRADQCHALPPEMDDGVGAMMEPLAVALHAVQRAGPVAGRRVLVTGGGQIGLLALLVARALGATPVALSDVIAARRQAARDLGADAVLDPAAPDLAAQVQALAGDGFDIVIEASGAPPALRQAFDLARPGGILVQVGSPGTADVPLPANLLMIRELEYRGSFRYADVYDAAIRLVTSGRVNVRPLISRVFPLADAGAAMTAAGDKDRVIKVQLAINQGGNA